MLRIGGTEHNEVRPSLLYVVMYIACSKTSNMLYEYVEYCPTVATQKARDHARLTAGVDVQLKYITLSPVE